jgi:hypothetical protein
MTKEVPLTQGQVAIVDAADYDWLSEWKWFAAWAPDTQSFYAARTDRTGPKPPACRRICMHQAIWIHRYGPIPNGFTVDHTNRKTLDNCRSELRLATPSQQAQNRRLRRDNTSGYRGVRWHKRDRTWLSEITVNRKRIYLGSFHDAIDAARAYDVAAIYYYGEFAVLNFPESVAL